MNKFIIPQGRFALIGEPISLSKYGEVYREGVYHYVYVPEKEIDQFLIANTKHIANSDLRIEIIFHELHTIHHILDDLFNSERDIRFKHKENECDLEKVIEKGQELQKDFECSIKDLVAHLWGYDSKLTEEDMKNHEKDLMPLLPQLYATSGEAALASKREELRQKLLNGEKLDKLYLKESITNESTESYTSMNDYLVKNTRYISNSDIRVITVLKCQEILGNIMKIYTEIKRNTNEQECYNNKIKQNEEEKARISEQLEKELYDLASRIYGAEKQLTEKEINEYSNELKNSLIQLYENEKEKAEELIRKSDGQKMKLAIPLAGRF